MPTTTTPDTPRLRLEFQLTEDDLREAMRAHNGRAFLRAIIIMVVAAGFMFWQLLGNSPSTDDTGERSNAAAERMLLTVAWVLLFLMLWRIAYVLVGGGARRAWEGAPSLRLPRAIEVDGARLFS